MNADDDPFGLMDSERTQISRPVPGGRGVRAAAAPRVAPVAEPGGRRVGSVASVTGTPGRGPLVECAFGLLSMVPLLRTPTPPMPPDDLRAQIEAELNSFTERAHARGLDNRMVALGHYALCALFDDVILNTPWGAHSSWQSNSLAGALHGDVAAGEHLFEYLDQAKAQGQRSRPVLELIAACLALGFEGQYRIRPQGQIELRHIRGELLAMLQRYDADHDPALSGHWRGAAAAHRPIGQGIPVWVYGTAALALLVLAYAGMVVRLGERGAHLGDAVASLPASETIEIVQPAAAAPAPVPVPKPLVLGPRLRACLPEGARDQGDAVSETLQGVKVRLPNAGLFTSGSADLQAAVTPTLQCLGQVLKMANGRVVVVGHTDNVPIRTARFPSNWELSKARADSVAAVLRPVMARPVQVVGRGDAEPIAPNTAEDGRSRNRRVEILLIR
ncbi:MAG TPA: type IVB secretion system protein IcmH/DotU [Rhodopila sp.]|nr:type IVB secretion system protein IcmH/DotU [Rhodopila sp.]